MPDHESVRRLRAHAQALAGGAWEVSAEAVVRRVFAIQAQDATAADLGIRVRGRDITAQAIRTAYEDERSIVRNWYMRGTLHTIPSDDARWVLQLLAPRILAVTSRRYQQLGLDDDLRQRADHLIRRVLAAHGPLTRGKLTERLTILGISPDGQAPFYLIRHAALTGILCHGPQRAGEATYALYDDWLPPSGRFRWEGDAALAELARRYLAAHAPATLEDFAAWSGLPVTWARRAWKILAESGAITKYGALTMLAGRVEELPGAPGTPDVRMLPAYDNYLIGILAHLRAAGLGALADLGFRGLDNDVLAPGIVTGFHASRTHKLTPGEKTANRVLAVGRAPVEHGFAHLKNWRILTKLRTDPARATRLVHALLVLTNLEVNR